MSGRVKMSALFRNTCETSGHHGDEYYVTATGASRAEAYTTAAGILAAACLNAGKVATEYKCVSYDVK